MTISPKFAPKKTGVLVLADGTAFYGQGFGAIGETIGEVCFNTAITGYQEILTDPSYNQQIVAFTAPHIGNVGTNDEDEEANSEPAKSGAIGMISRAFPTKPSNWRSSKELPDWLVARNIVGLAGVDTRSLTHLIREKGMPHGAIAHNPDGIFDIAALQQKAIEWSGLEGLDLAKDVTTNENYDFAETVWHWPDGVKDVTKAKYHVVLLDFGAKANILRDLGEIGAKVTILPASASFEDVMAYKPDGVMLSNGPGDPAATGEYAVTTIKKVVASGVPVFGICLGHQMLGLALGGKTVKMKQGHHGANHPVKDLKSGKVEIVSMNHGFAVDAETLPKEVELTHVSLFDGSNCGISTDNGNVFSVQYHPEASPGPKDSFYLFQQFAKNMDKYKAK